MTYALNSSCNIAAQSRIEGISDYSVFGMLDDNPTIYVYSHSETLPFGYAAEYFLESVTTDEETE